MRKVIYQAEEEVTVEMPEGKDIEEVINLFKIVSAEQNWKNEGELTGYPKASVYFSVRVGGVLAGALQLVVGNELGLPCLTSWPELNLLGRKDIADIALTAINKRYRGRSQEIFWLLNVEMWRYCVQNGHTNLVAELPPRVLKVYRRLEWPFKIIGELRQHWGEDCYAGIMTTDEILMVIKRKALASRRYEKFLEEALRPF